MSIRLPAIGSSEPWRGGWVTLRAFCVLAPNPSPMTLDGTNTWLLAAPDAQAALIVDPGPLRDGHGAAITSTLRERDLRAAGILLTHGHADHSEGARALAERLGCTVRALDPGHRLGSEGLADGDVVSEAGIEVRVVATPGHSADSLTFHLAEDAALITGDTLLGRGTTVVAHPDGRLDAYLHSLARLRRFAEETRALRVLPGHGPALADPVALLDAYIEHRNARLEQIRLALDAGARTPSEVVEVVYGDVPPGVRFAAELSVRAQLDYLRG